MASGVSPATDDQGVESIRSGSTRFLCAAEIGVRAALRARNHIGCDASRSSSRRLAQSGSSSTDRRHHHVRECLACRVPRVSRSHCSRWTNLGRGGEDRDTDRHHQAGTAAAAARRPRKRPPNGTRVIRAARLGPSNSSDSLRHILPYGVPAAGRCRLGVESSSNARQVFGPARLPRLDLHSAARPSASDRAPDLRATQEMPRTRRGGRSVLRPQAAHACRRPQQRFRSNAPDDQASANAIASAFDSSGISRTPGRHRDDRCT